MRFCPQSVRESKNLNLYSVVSGKGSEQELERAFSYSRKESELNDFCIPCIES